MINTNKLNKIFVKNKDLVLIFLIFLAGFVFSGAKIELLYTPISVIIVFIVAHIFHEHGHYLSHYLNHRNPKIRYNKLKLPIRVTAIDTEERPFTSGELAKASLCGIMAGLIPIGLYLLLSFNIIGAFVLKLFYIYASRFDILDIKNHVNNKIFIQSRLNKMERNESN